MTKDEALKLALHGLEMGVTLIEDFGSKEQLNTQHKAIAAIYEALSQSTWVNLTSEEIGEIYRVGWANNMELARAIEAKLKEKNERTI